MVLGAGPKKGPSTHPWSTTGHAARLPRIFYFYILYFRFLQKYILFSKFTGIYPGRPAAGRPGLGRPAAGRQGLLCKKFSKNICAQVPGGQSPGSGAAGPPGRPAVGRPDLPPLYKGWLVPHPSFASLKF